MRKKLILDELNKNDVIYIKKLDLLLSDTSISTIRRDLRELAEEGKVILLRGGAVKKNDNPLELPMETKEQMFIGEKDRIAKCAADLIQDGDAVYIDSGTTTARIVKFISSNNVTIVTSNLAILGVVKERGFNCIMLGGFIRHHLDSVVGTHTDSMLSYMNFNKAFMGASGYSLDGGYSTPSFQEGSKKQIAIKKSDESYMLLDDSKLYKDSICKIADIDDCIIITNKENEILKKIKNYIIAKS